jgi:integrase
MRGSVYKRGSTWTWHVDVGVDPVTGTRRQQTKGGFKTKRECQAALNDALAALRAGTLVKPSKRTLESFLVGEWLPALRNLRPSTFSNYRTHIRTCVLPAIGPIPLQQLSPAHLNAFYQALLTQGRLRDGHGMAPKTVQNVHAILHRALKDAMRWGYVARNVADAVDPPKGLPAERRVWTPEQLRAFLSHMRNDRLYAAWLLVATTGLRRAELAGLRWVDVDFATGRVSPRRPRVVVDYTVVESDAKTPKGRRSLALDPATLAVSRLTRPVRPRRGRSSAPATKTPGWSSPCPTARRSTRSGSPPGSCSTPAQPGCRGSGCTMSATATPPPRWRPASRPR